MIRSEHTVRSRPPKVARPSAVLSGVVRRATFLAVLVVVLAGAGPGAAAQEPWLLLLEGDAAMPAGEPQSRLFGTGGSLAGGLYRPLGRVVVPGLRLRGALLPDGDPPVDGGRVDPGTGGLATLALALRLRPAAPSGDPRRGVGPFVEVAGGPALTGHVVRAGLEAGIGWGFEVGALDVAPTLRYLQIVQPDDQLDGRDARLVLVGIGAVLLDARPAPPPPPPPAPEPPPRPAPEPGDRDEDGILDPDDACPDDPEDADGFEDGDGCPDLDNDGDAILDVDDACPNEREVVNGVDDEDGCPDEGLIEFVDDRIRLDDRVLFAFDRADVRPRANAVLDAIITLWRQHPEWHRVRIEGHTDIRGTPAYNQRLSERRARAVMEALIERGMPREMLEAVGYGETRPLNLGTREATHRRNRRVEFVVLSRRPVEPGGEPEPPTRETDREEDR